MAGVEVGLVGLPNSGKSTLFNALTGGGAAVAPHMFSTIETVHGVADVRDPRLDALDAVSSSRSGKIVPATLEVVDIAGLVRGASHGEGLGNQFLGSLRNTDAVVHVLRCFHDDSVAPRRPRSTLFTASRWMYAARWPRRVLNPSASMRTTSR